MLWFLATVTLAASAQPANLVTTPQQHTQWMEQLSRQPVVRQRAMIADRLLADTLIAVHPYYSHVGRMSEQQKEQVRKQRADSLRNKFEGILTPLIVIDGYPIQQALHERQPAAELSAFATLIRITPFKHITQLNGSAAAAIYGSRGANGVLLMELEYKKQLQKFRAIRQEPAPTP